MKKLFLLFAVFAGFTGLLKSQDLQVLSINTPQTACGHTGAEQVNITLLNISGVGVNAPYTINYTVNGGSVVSQNITGAANNIGPVPATKTLSFSTTVNMSAPGAYNFKVWVTAASDIDHSNDTLIKSVNSDANTIPGTVLTHDTVCAGNNGGTLILSGQLGTVTNWIVTNSGGVSVVGVTDTFLTYTNLTETTTFQARVRNGTCPFDTSAPAIITVDAQTLPGIISGDGAVCIGSSGNLTLTGHNGTILDWESSQNLAGPWNSLSNTTAIQPFTNIQLTSDTFYRAISQVGVCPEDTSPVATLTLDQPSLGGTVSQKTGSTPVCSGSNSGTLVLRNHRGSVVNWQRSVNGGAFTNVAPINTDTILSYSNLTAQTRFRAVVKNGSCVSINSTNFQINVDSTTLGGTIDNNATVCSGSNAGTLTLQNHRGAVQFWEQSINGGGTWTTIMPINTTTSQGYNNLTQTTLYRVQVKNGSCSQVPSASATITVSSPTIGGTVASTDPTSVCSGNNTGTLTYSGGNGTVVRWEFSTNGGATYNPVSPANISATHNYTNLTTTTRFRVVAQNSPCPAANSNEFTITVLPASVAGTIGGAGTICSGNNANLTLTGHSGTIKRWEVSTNAGATFSTVAGSPGQTNITPTVSVNSLFRVIIQNGTCDSAITPNKTVNVSPNTVPGTVAGSTTVCGGSNSGNVTLSGHTGAIQGWIRSTNGGANWTNVGSTVNPQSYNNLTQTTLYAARVKSGVCPEDTSAIATITVTPAALGGTASLGSADTLCAANGVLTTVTTSSTHTGTVIGWQSSINGGATYSIIAGAVGGSAAFNFNYTTNTLFRAMVQNGAGCDTVFSSSVMVVVNQATVAGTTAGAATVCGGSNNGNVTLSGNTGNVVRWESSTNGGAVWTPIASSASTTYNYTGLNQNTHFRAVVQNGLCASRVSDSVLITIIPAAIGGTVTYAGGNVCSGTNMVTLNLTGSSGTIVRWQKSTNGGGSFSNIANTTTSLTDSNLTTNTIYRAVLQSGACPNVNSISDTVFVDAVSNAGTMNGSVTVCDTGNAGILHISGYNGSVVRWRSQLNGGGFSNVAGSVGEDTISYTNLTAGTHDYIAIVQNGVCPNDTSIFGTITVDPDVVAGTLNGGTSYCTPVNSTLLQLNGFTGNINVWQQSTNGGASFTNVPSSAGRDTITFVNITVPTIYRVIVSSGVCGSDTSNTQTIGVGQSIAGTLNSSSAVCISGNADTLLLTGHVGSVIKWQDSLSGGAWVDHTPLNAGSDTLSYLNLTTTTSYRVIVQSGSCDPDTSNFVTIDVSDTVSAGTLLSDLNFCDTTNMDTLALENWFGPVLNWQSSINGGPFTDFSPVRTDSFFVFTNLKDSSSRYRVVMDGGVCGNDTSNIVEVNVGASLAGILPPNDTVCSGNNMGVINLTGYVGNILSWDSSTVAGIFSPIGHTLDSLVYLNADDTISYRVRVENPGCPPDTSNTYTIVTVPGTTSGTLTGTRSFCSSTNLDSVILVGRVGNILAWEQSLDTGKTWSNIPSQTSDTLIYTNLTQTTMYRVIVQGSGLCPDDTSNVAVIQVGPSFAGTISGDTLLCEGSLATLTTSGFVGDVVTWESSSDSIVFTPIAASDSSLLTFTVSDTTYFRVIVQSDTCDSDTSAAFMVAVDRRFAGSLVTPTTQLCYGVGSDTIFLSGAADTIYDWEIREDSVSLFASLANDTTFQRYDTLKITTHYRVFVQNGVCPVDTVSLTLTVDTFTVAGTIASSDTVCAGNNSDTIRLTGFIGNTFNWEQSVNGGPFGPATGATNDSFYVYNNLTDTTLYRLVVASGGCPPDTTDTVQISVKPAAIGGSILSDTSFCEGPNEGTLILTGHTGNNQGWQRAIGGGTFSDVTPPNTTDSLAFLNLDTTTSYRVIFSLGDCPNDTSAIATVTVLNTPVVSITPDGPTEFCAGETVNLTASGGPDYAWNTSDTVATISAAVTSTYVVVVTDTTTNCSATDSIDVNVFPLPIVNAGADVTILEGSSTTLGASGAQIYSWSPITGLDNPAISAPVATPIDTIIYVVTGIDSNGCESVDSVTVFVIPDPNNANTTFTNLFTPNGDGYNDYWRIRDIAECNTCQVAIYNRYGLEVFNDPDYQDDWTGTFNGKKLPDGTYYYIVTTESDKIFKGAITIIRGE